jgi:hypothetical protein
MTPPNLWLSASQTHVHVSLQLRMSPGQLVADLKAPVAVQKRRRGSPSTAQHHWSLAKHRGDSLLPVKATTGKLQAA